MKIVLFSERLRPPADEGIKNTALGLAGALKTLGHEVRVLTTRGRDWPERDVVNIRAGRILFSTGLRKAVRNFRPDAVIYVPTASLTLGSAVRGRVLKRHGNGVPLALAALQGRRHGRLAGHLAGFLAPDICLTLSGATREQATALGWRTGRLLPIVDPRIFKPVSVGEKAALREERGLPPRARIVLHVGPLVPSRGIDDLSALAGIAEPLLVLGPGEPRDAEWMERLKQAGVRIISEYIENIQELYQAADAYLFPAPPSATAPGCIDFPLSVLEAFACNLPVIATRFGALPEYWPENKGIRYYERKEELPVALNTIPSWSVETRPLVGVFCGERAAQGVLAALRAPKEAAWGSYLAASWWQDDAPPPGESCDPGSVVSFLRRNRFPLLSLIGDDRPAAAACLAAEPFIKALREDDEAFHHKAGRFPDVADAWRNAGISWLFIKALGPPPLFPYTSGNLDVLVRPERLAEARRILRELDFIELRHLEEPRKYLYRRYRAGEPFFDIHLHGRVEWHVPFLDEEDVWKHSRLMDETIPGTRIPCPEDGLLIAVAHAVFENKAVSLADLAGILFAAHAPGLDWDRVLSSARRRGWSSGFRFGLALCVRLETGLFGTTHLRTRMPTELDAGLTRRLETRAAALASGRETMPFRLSFPGSKALFYRKIWADEAGTVGDRFQNTVSHTLRGIRLRSKLRSQRPMLISFDGIDGSGKTALAEILARAFDDAAVRRRIVWIRGGSTRILRPARWIGKRILGRAGAAASVSPEAKEADRAVLFRHRSARAIWPWMIFFEGVFSNIFRVGLPLLGGCVVIADRYVLSTLIEAGARLDKPSIARTLPARLLKRLSPKPRFSFWLDIPWPAALDRRSGAESPGFLKKQAELAPRLAGEARAERIDGEVPLSAIAESIVPRVLRTYLDGHRTFLNGMFFSNPRPLERDADGRTARETGRTD